ncbi:Anti-sigma regulatory factor (Ser/Thr protein kinase) [Micromonospora sediminicola]|uniref:Anti-sigma regulatory factor (Ser/Thr protein kinase) n=1 Tax=Micromonospora sediminicola TaxID=946078 RepID=A0A1A9BFF3_9ACTN|nr:MULTISPECIES: anti-sigma factor RsbA family regulatory protein [Micromonospora]PGH45748.1 sensor histidine kinase [Micromonospora sp. WMMA1996]SBT67684.1 Anti-sigma regulatory factor (Ser/Thr protein kinase) [Micromonospora sediminicola]
MRTGAAAGHTGYFHEALLYDSDDELLAVVLPFLRGGVEAGEPTVVGLGGRNADLVRRALPTGADVTFLPGGDVYARPTGAIRAYRELLGSHVAAGAPQIRIVGELPAVLFGATWDAWARYESAINHAYDDFPLWSMCAYDRRVAPPHVLADVARTHPRVATPDGRHEPTGVYTEPATYLSECRPAPLDPVQHTVPEVELSDPTPARARAAVRAADRGLLPPDDLDDLVMAVSEVVCNALRHGTTPVCLRLWRAPDRLVVAVHDRGPGPKDPYAGLLPAGDGSEGGLGLWITHQSCDHVTHHRDADGFTIRLTVGNPHFPV